MSWHTTSDENIGLQETSTERRSRDRLLSPSPAPRGPLPPLPDVPELKELDGGTTPRRAGSSDTDAQRIARQQGGTSPEGFSRSGRYTVAFRSGHHQNTFSDDSDRFNASESAVRSSEELRNTQPTPLDPPASPLPGSALLDNDLRSKGMRPNLSAAAAWAECARLLREEDDELIEGWSDEIDALLVFAGLFSAVVTGFNVQTYQALSPDQGAILMQISQQLQNPQMTQAFSSPPPQVTDVIINAFLFASLLFSLMAASLGIFLKQWLREYRSRVSTTARRTVRIRHIRHEALVKWRVKEFVMLLPLLLQIALILFFIGLSVLVFTLNTRVGILVIVLVAIWLTFTVVTAVLPAISEDCAYKSPQARVFFTLGQWMKSCVRDTAKNLFESLMHKRELPLPMSANPQLRSLALMRAYTTWNAFEVHRVNKAKSPVDAHALAATDNLFRDDDILDTVIRPCLDDLELDKAIPCLDEIYSNRITGYAAEGEHDSVTRRPVQGTTRGLKATILLAELALDILKRIDPETTHDDFRQEYLLQHIITCLRQLLSEIPGGIPLNRAVLLTLTSMLSREMLRTPCFTLIVDFADNFDGVDIKAVKALLRHSSRARADDSVIGYLQTCLIAVRFSTLLPPEDYDGIRGEIQSMLSNLRQYLSTPIAQTVEPLKLMHVLYTHVQHLSELPEQDCNSVTGSLLDVLEEVVQAAENTRDINLQVRPRAFRLYASKVRKVLQNARDFHRAPGTRVTEPSIQMPEPLLGTHSASS